MDKKIILDRILNYFKVKDIPNSLDDKRKKWEEVVCCNNLKDVSKDILEDEDKFLRLELMNRELVNGEKLKTIDLTLDSDIKYCTNIALWQGDITRIYVDIIANLTDVDMLSGKIFSREGLGKEVFLRSGMRQRIKCMDLMKNEKLKPSDILIIRGYNLPCDYVIHVINADNQELIKEAYMKVLTCARNNMVEYIAIPNLGDLKIGVDTLREFFELYGVCFKKVIFVAKNKREYDKLSDLLVSELLTK